VLQDPKVQEAVAELQQLKEVLANLQAKYQAALEEAAALENAPPTVESYDEAEDGVAEVA
jgi:prefoldin subunit 5